MARRENTVQHIHIFGGCNRLLGQYQVVGGELLKYEEASRIYRPDSYGLKNFREGVTFIPLEVLESYLEDLLDPAVTDTRLFLERSSSNLKNKLVVALCILVAIGLLFSSIFADTPSFLAGGIVLCLASPFIIFGHLPPQMGVTRRMIFAQVLTQEIARRRNSDGPMIRTFSSRWGASLV